MNKEEKTLLRIRKFDAIPSAEEFASQLEPTNVPAVFHGCIKNWKAFSHWNPSNGGLDYLQGKVGSSVVEAMLSKTTPVFNGDIRSHERGIWCFEFIFGWRKIMTLGLVVYLFTFLLLVPMPFSTFIGYCNEVLQDRDGSHGVGFVSEKDGLPTSEEQEQLRLSVAPQQIYLAQVPIMNIESDERVQLGILNGDILKPALLESKDVTSINLWMNSSQTRSSTHYDPHHNLLCIVAGHKQVVLWPPSASPSLYALPIYGEASNHSAIAVEEPDISVHPRAKQAIHYSQRIILHAGDALFIPEGWFHQVDSDKLTIAVNFWWRSKIMSDMLEHMDAYYLRRIIKSPHCLLSSGQYQLLHKASAGEIYWPINQRSGCVKSSQGTKLNPRIMLHELEPFALQSLHELISLVHNRTSVADPGQPVESTETISAVLERGGSRKPVTADLYELKDDPVASIFWSLKPLALQRIFLAMAHFPRTLEALILHLVSPVGAELLTRKFDEMDQLTVEEDRNKFYRTFYGVFDDHFAAMDALLDGKESFTFQAFKNVLDQYLGVKFEGTKPLVGRDSY